MSLRLPLSLTALGICAFAAAGCAKAPPNGAAAGRPAQLPAGMILSAAPASAKEVAAARKDVTAGQEIVVHGRIAGRKEPFVSGRAIFTLADMSLPPCNANPEDSCPTPWDLCCEPQDKLTDGSVTIRMVDAAGQVIRGELNGVAGLKPLAEVTVKARVSSAESGQSVVLDAKAIYVKPG
jgi:hypothetical protein